MAEKKSKWPILVWLGVLVLAGFTYLKSCTGPDANSIFTGGTEKAQGLAGEAAATSAGKGQNAAGNASEIASLTGDNKKLRAENWQLLEKIALLESANQAAEQDEPSTSMSESAKAEIENLSAELTSAQTQIGDLQSSAGGLIQERDELLGKLGEQQAKATEYKSSLDEVQSERDGLSTQLQNLTAQAGTYKTEMQSANSAVDALGSGVIGAFKQQLPNTSISLDTGSVDQGLTARLMGLSAALPGAVSSFAQDVGERAGAESRAEAASQIKTLTDSLTKMKTDLSGVETEKESLQQQLAEATQSKEMLNSSLASLTEDKNNLEFAYNQLKSASESEPVNPTGEDNVLNTEVAQLRVQVVNLVGQNKLLGEQLAQAKEMASSIGEDPAQGTKLTELTDKLSDTENSLQQVMQNADKTASELESAKKNIIDLNNEISALSQEKQTLMADVTGAQQAAQNADKTASELVSAQEKIVDLNNEVNVLSQEKQKLMADVTGAQQAAQNADKTASELVSAQEKIVDLNNEVNVLSQEKQKLMADVTGAQQAAKDADKTASELTSAQEKIVDLNNEINSLGQEKQKLMADAAKAQEQAGSVKSELSAELTSAQQKIGDLTSQINTLSQEKENLLQDVAKTREQADSLNTELTKVVTMRDTLGSELENVKTMVSELSVGKEQTGAILQSTNDALTNLAKQKLDSDQQITTLRKRIEEQKLDFDIKYQELEENTSLIRIDSDIAYKSGSAVLEPEGKEILALIAQSLNRYENRDVSLEGHTDNLPIKKGATKFDSNWELSAARASGAARYLIQQGVDASRLRAVGFGSSRPIASNDSRDDRSKNRRLEIRFVPAKLKEKVESVN